MDSSVQSNDDLQGRNIHVSLEPLLQTFDGGIVLMLSITATIVYTLIASEVKK